MRLGKSPLFWVSLAAVAVAGAAVLLFARPLEAPTETVQATPPPPLSSEPAVGAKGPGPIALLRYPTIRSPALMRPRRTETVRVSLEERRETSTVVTHPDGGLEPTGRVSIELPGRYDEAEEEAWRVQVQLSMPGAKVDPGSQAILLRKSGPADEATFKVRPLWRPASPTERRETPLLAVFSRNGRVFARALRMVSVTADPAYAPPAVPIFGLQQGGDPGEAADVADLYVEVITLARAVGAEGAAAGPSDRFLVQAQLRGTDAVPVGGDRIVVMDGLDAFLVERYSKLAGLVPRGAAALDDPAARVAAADAVRQLGADLWKRFLPEILKSRILALQRSRARGADVRIQSNDPRIPFELLLVPVDGKGDCERGAECELLGVLHRLSRWHVDSALGVNPDVRTREGRIGVIAPAYAEPLRGAASESGALERLAGSRYEALSGSFGKVVDELEAPEGLAVLHYAGHAEARRGVLSGSERYSLELEDRPLDLDTFRQHVAWLRGNRGIGPLVFLNACDVGRAEGAYGFAEGWGPAALEKGAAGFIGGLWPLGDRGASEFARKFYERALAGVPVAEALRATRESYAAAADPTYVAYVYYGHPDLQISPAR